MEDIEDINDAVEQDKSLQVSTSKIISIEDKFAESEKMVRDEMAKTEELYEEIKTHYDSVKGIKSRLQQDMNSAFPINANESPRINAFIHLQTTNLITIRAQKLAQIKELNSIIKSHADLTLKEFATILREKIANQTDGDENAIAVAKQLVSILLNRSNENDFKNVVDADIIESDIDDALELRLAVEEVKNILVDKEPDFIDSKPEYLSIPGIEGEFYLVVDETTKELLILNSDENVITLEEAGLSDFEFEVTEEDGIYYEHKLICGPIASFEFEDESDDDDD